MGEKYEDEEITEEDAPNDNPSKNSELESSDDWVTVKKTLVQASSKAEDELQFPINGVVSKLGISSFQESYSIIKAYTTYAIRLI